MLNPKFPKEISNLIPEGSYSLPERVAALVKDNNANLINPTEELRLDSVYTDEIWKKINSLLPENFDWEKARVLDVCCGLGFVSYHLLKKVKPKELVALDINKAELQKAKKLLQSSYPSYEMSFLEVDINDSSLKEKGFDIVIGNSFLHHFYNLPLVVNNFSELIIPGGYFISLHEPTISAIAYESKNPLHLLRYLRSGENYIELIRKKNKHPIDTDVWIFKIKDLEEIFIRHGFRQIKVDSWNMLRALGVTWLNLTPSPNKLTLSKFKRILLVILFRLDIALKKILPKNSFGSVAVIAKK